MSEAWIIDAVRSPIGRRHGALSHLRGDEVAARVLRGLVDRSGVPPADVEDVILGCVTPVGEQGWNLGRLAPLLAGFPVETCGVQVNRMCGSSLQALHYAAQGVISGVHDLVIAAGVEMMSRVPMGTDGGDLHPDLPARYPLTSQLQAAELVARHWRLARPQLDEFSYHSHRKAVAGQAEGRFTAEIIPIPLRLPDGSGSEFNRDETPRPDTSLERIAALPALHGADGVIHAGNSSQIADGAAAVLVAAPQKARQLGLRPRARIRAMALAGVDPTMMLHGVIPATHKVLHKAGLTLREIDLYEVNEAFAPVPLAWLHETGADPQRLNVNGGAIALGHPLGASGARITATLLHELERREGRYGLATMCIGFGMAVATVIERVAP